MPLVVSDFLTQFETLYVSMKWRRDLLRLGPRIRAALTLRALRSFQGAEIFREAIPAPKQ